LSYRPASSAFIYQAVHSQPTPKAFGAALPLSYQPV
jgi:hypothetical protein